MMSEELNQIFHVFFFWFFFYDEVHMKIMCGYCCLLFVACTEDHIDVVADLFKLEDIVTEVIDSLYISFACITRT